MVNWPGFRSLIFGAISIFKIIFSINGAQLKIDLFNFSKLSFSVLLIQSEITFSPAPKPDTQPSWPARPYISTDTRHLWCAIRTVHLVINCLKIPEVHRFWYSSPLICSTHFLGQIRLIPDYLDLYHPKIHVPYRPLYLGQTLILNIIQMTDIRLKIIQHLAQLHPCFLAVDGLDRVGQLA